MNTEQATETPEPAIAALETLMDIGVWPRNLTPQVSEMFHTILTALTKA